MQNRQIRGSKALSSQRKKPRRKPVKKGLLPSVQRLLGLLNLKAVLVGLVAIFIITISIFALTRKNAYSVFVGNQEVAVIRLDKSINNNELVEFAIFTIENELNTKILVNEEVDFQRIRTPKRNTVSPDVAIMRMASAFTYKIEAVLIQVDGIDMAILKNAEEAELVKNRIIQRFTPNDDSIIERAEFLEDYKEQKIFVELLELNTQNEAYNILTQTNEALITHIVQPKENLGVISQKSGMTIEEILALNPGRSRSDILGIGDELVLSLPKPLLSVVTYERVTYLEVLKREVQTVENSNMQRGQTRAVQHGQDGEAQITALRVRINGIEDVSLLEVIETQIISEPIPEIIEVGVK